MLISVPHIKDHVKSSKHKKDMEDYNNAIYHFSHKRMVKLSKNKAFQFLFEDFIRSGEYGEFTDLDSQDPVYKEQILSRARQIIDLWRVK